MGVIRNIHLILVFKLSDYTFVSNVQVFSYIGHQGDSMHKVKKTWFWKQVESFLLLANMIQNYLN